MSVHEKGLVVGRLAATRLWDFVQLARDVARGAPGWEVGRPLVRRPTTSRHDLGPEAGKAQNGHKRLQDNAER